MYNKAGGKVYRGLRINRYIMECKYKQKKELEKAGIELIDTLWNVNLFNTILNAFEASELIDTLWNVNTVEHEFPLIEKGN